MEAGLIDNNEEKKRLQQEEKQKKEEVRTENWDSFQRLEEFDDLNKGFTRIKKEILRNQRIVKDVTKQRKKVLYSHYQTLENRYLGDQEKQALSKN